MQEYRGKHKKNTLSRCKRKLILLFYTNMILTRKLLRGVIKPSTEQPNFNYIVSFLKRDFANDFTQIPHNISTQYIRILRGPFFDLMPKLPTNSKLTHYYRFSVMFDVFLQLFRNIFFQFINLKKSDED